MESQTDYKCLSVRPNKPMESQTSLMSLLAQLYINCFGESYCEQVRKVSKTFSVVFDHIVNYKATFSNLVVASAGIFGHHFGHELF